MNVPDFLKRAPRVFVIACCAGAIFLPPMIGNFGLGLKSGGPIGVMPYSDGLAFQRTYVGEIAAVDKICQAIPANSSVLIADYTMNQQFAQAIRGTCDVPVAGVQTVIPNANTAPGNNIAAGHRSRRRPGHREGRPSPASSSRPTESRSWSQLGNGTVIHLVMTRTRASTRHIIFGTPRNTCHPDVHGL